MERSRQKSDMLQGYGDTVLRAKSLEKEPDKARKHSALLQSKQDGAFAQYLLMVLTTKFRPSKAQIREGYTTSFMHIFGTNKVPRVVLQRFDVPWSHY
jgi:hypothetical protein